MQPVFKRIAINGTLTALVLGGIGFLFAEIAGMWLTGSANRTPQESDVDLRGAIRQRTPLVMAGCGFLFLAVAELVMFAVRGEPKAKDAKTAKAATQPDEAELLLEELLKQAEAKAAQEQGTGSGSGSPAQNGSPNGGGGNILTPNPYPPSPNH